MVFRLRAHAAIPGTRVKTEGCSGAVLISEVMQISMAQTDWTVIYRHKPLVTAIHRHKPHVTVIYRHKPHVTAIHRNRPHVTAIPGPVSG